MRLAEAVSMVARIWFFLTLVPTFTLTAVTVPEAPKESEELRELARLPEPLTVAVTLPVLTVAVRVVAALLESEPLMVR